MDDDSFPGAFVRTAERFPEHLALELGNTRLTYRELAQAAMAIAAALQRGEPSEPVGLLARHSAEAYVGLLGTFLSGHAYLPLSPEYPAQRNVEMLRQAGGTRVLVDRAGRAAFNQVASRMAGITALPLEAANRDSSIVSTWIPPHIRDDSTAYVIFTSGSSGFPKGTRLTHGNVAAAIDAICGRLQPSTADRISQIFELTFDGSLFGTFLAWTSGACLVPVTPGAILEFRTAIQRTRITVWTATPSSLALMRRLRFLQPNAFRDLRYSVIAGEPIEMDLLAAWARAAPNSIIDNVYGPTEATIACTAYRWDRDAAVAAAAATAPIGTFLGETHGRIVDETLQDVPDGEIGELLLAGPQVSPGYLDEQLTRDRFLRPVGSTITYYRTGDLVRRDEGCMHYVGRLDHQVKIRGHRVELGEIESHLTRLAPGARTAAIAWPKSANGAEGIVAFVEGDAAAISVDTLQRALASSLPKPMVPQRIFALPQLPMSAHGKLDRRALERMVAKEDAIANGIVVLGIPRSGTTLLAQLLDAHPSVACPGETYLLNACARFIESDTMPNGVGVGVLQGLRHLDYAPEDVLQRLRNWVVDVHTTHAAAHGKTHWAEKTAVNVFYLDEIERLIGNDAKFVVVLRHGLDVAASLVELSEKVGGYYRELHAWIVRYRHPAEAFARMWCERTAALLDLVERRGPRAYVVRYEDLVEEPERTLNDLFRFLGVAEQSGLAERALARPVSFGIGDWKAQQSRTVSTASVGRWKRLFAPHIPKLARIVNPDLVRAGYPPVEQLDDYAATHHDRYAAAARLAHLVPRGVGDGA